MKTILSLATPAEVDTECLVAVVLDRNEGKKDKPQVSVETADAAVKEACAEVIASGEVTGKMLEITLLHNPAKLKAKRRTAARRRQGQEFLGFRVAKDWPELPCARSRAKAYAVLPSLLPQGNLKIEESVGAIVEGAFVGNFDSDYLSERPERSDH